MSANNDYLNPSWEELSNRLEKIEAHISAVAQGSGDMDVWTTDGLLGPRGKWLSYGGTLAKLADRLRESGK